MATAEIIICPTCGAKNRVPSDKLQSGGSPICGRCKTSLTAKPSPLVVTDATFAEQVERAPLPVLVDMWAPWCGPCRMIAPAIDQLATEMAGRVRFAKLNVDENQRTAARFNIRSIPALLIFKAGQEIGRIEGAHPKAEIARRLEQLIA